MLAGKEGLAEARQEQRGSGRRRREKGKEETNTPFVSQCSSSQHNFPIVPLQPPAPAPASPTIFFSHTTPVPASNSSVPNAVMMFSEIIDAALSS